MTRPVSRSVLCQTKLLLQLFHKSSSLKFQHLNDSDYKTSHISKWIIHVLFAHINNVWLLIKTDNVVLQFEEIYDVMFAF